MLILSRLVVDKKLVSVNIYYAYYGMCVCVRERERERERGRERRGREREKERCFFSPEIPIFRRGLPVEVRLFLFCFNFFNFFVFTGQLNPKFPYSEADYLSKCDLIATAINQWNQAPYVREFFAEPPRAYRGLPRYINSSKARGATK